MTTMAVKLSIPLFYLNCLIMFDYLSFISLLCSLLSIFINASTRCTCSSGRKRTQEKKDIQSQSFFSGRSDLFLSVAFIQQSALVSFQLFPLLIDSLNTLPVFPFYSIHWHFFLLIFFFLPLFFSFCVTKCK